VPTGVGCLVSLLFCPHAHDVYASELYLGRVSPSCRPSLHLQVYPLSCTGSRVSSSIHLRWHVHQPCTFSRPLIETAPLTQASCGRGLPLGVPSCMPCFPLGPSMLFFRGLCRISWPWLTFRSRSLPVAPGEFSRPLCLLVPPFFSPCTFRSCLIMVDLATACTLQPPTRDLGNWHPPLCALMGLVVTPLGTFNPLFPILAHQL